MNFTRPIVLATKSPARRELIAKSGIEFISDSVDIDESVLPNETVEDYVRRLARTKSETVIPPSLDAVIVAVDTAIALGTKIIGKPTNEKYARYILEELSGKTHIVASAISLRDVAEASIVTRITKTSVKFVSLSQKMLDWYISTGEWKDRAGAYAIQDRGALLIEEVRGCFTNVIGISIPTLFEMLEAVHRIN